MPGVLPFIPLIAAGATMVGQNVQNKAAIKNNEVQQASAVGNAQAASNAAFGRENQWTQSNPSPYGNATIARPPGTPNPIGSIMGSAAQLMQPHQQPMPNATAFPHGTPDAPWSDMNAAVHAPGPFGPSPMPDLAHRIMQHFMASQPTINGAPVPQQPMGPRI